MNRDVHGFHTKPDPDTGLRYLLGWYGPKEREWAKPWEITKGCGCKVLLECNVDCNLGYCRDLYGHSKRRHISAITIACCEKHYRGMKYGALGSRARLDERMAEEFCQEVMRYWKKVA